MIIIQRKINRIRERERGKWGRLLYTGGQQVVNFIKAWQQIL